ncbi:MAG: glycogen/starch/alpha-glucan phosphorylase [Pseudomonadota bacterium]
MLTRSETSPNWNSASDIADEIVRLLESRLAKSPVNATAYDWFGATAHFVRDRAIQRWMETVDETYREGRKRVYYLSLEFLIGRLLTDAMSNLRLDGPIREALKSLGIDFDTIADLEPDAALGNGGLGRLAACFMESMASTGVPALGYGIRYVNGMFRQEMSDGWQVELPETWLHHGNPWEIERRERSYTVGFGGSVEIKAGEGTGQKCVWHPTERMVAVAYDTPVVGWNGDQVNTLRLWNALPLDPIHLDAFNAGDHIGALREANQAAAITRVLYPADSNPAGLELRLRQEYFFSSASLQDILNRHYRQYTDLRSLPEKAAIQLNDTHPAISVAELMRLLMDEHGFAFDDAWDITQRTFAYTNHTLLPEALESWPVPLFERLLPRNMQIIYAINAHVLKSARREGNASADAIRAISLIDEHGERRVRMGNLAFVGSHSVNGVSELHTDLMKSTVFSDLHKIYPSRINAKTNGITPRRWFMQCNPALYQLACEVADCDVMDNLERLSVLSEQSEDRALQNRFMDIKRDNKIALAETVRRRTGLMLDPAAMFDVQIKRIHEYKRQLLNIIETVALYDQIRSHPEKDWVPRVKFLAGKAAPSYHNAKLIIKLANDVSRVINNDPAVGDLLKVVFLPNYNVSLAEIMIPAADLSEQISTAGMEASGTGNMKFALNGALTIGTLDGANVEMLEHLGRDNMVIFGLTAQEVAEKRASGYRGQDAVDQSTELAQALSAISTGVFSPDDPARYRDLIAGVQDHDWFMVAADFEAYSKAQREVDALWLDRDHWNAVGLRNVGRMAWFSADRTIGQYASEIWGV